MVRRTELFVGVALAAGSAVALPTASVAGQAASSAVPRSVSARCVDIFRVPRASSAAIHVDPSSLATGDFGSDRWPDVAVARVGNAHFGGADPGGVEVLFGNGFGGFAPVDAGLALMGPSQRIVAGQFTADKHIDLVSTTTTIEGGVRTIAPTLTVLAGDGSGHFVARGAQRFGDAAMVNDVADVNRDGHADLLLRDYIYGNPGADEVRVLLNDGSGTFADAPGSPLTFSESGASVAAGDVDGDGVQDVVVGFYTAQKEYVKVYLGDGTGALRRVPRAVKWQPRSEYNTPSVMQLDVADFNRDGRADALVTLQAPPYASVLLADGTGHLREPRQRRHTARRPSSTAIGRFNSDLIPDVALSSGDSTYGPHGEPIQGYVWVLIGDGSGRFWEAPGSPEHAGSGLRELDVIDLNVDGRDDLVMLDVPSGNSGALRVLRNTAGRRRPGARVPLHNGPLTPPNGLFSHTYGTRLTLAAYFTCEPDGLAGRSLALYRRLDVSGRRGRWRRIAKLVTDARGEVRWAGQPRVNARYRWRPADRRQPRLKAAPVVQVPVAPSIRVFARGMRVTGRLRPPHPGAWVQLQRNITEDEAYGEEWATVARTRLDHRSRFRFMATRGGDYQVYRPADADNIAGTSDPVYLPAEAGP